MKKKKQDISKHDLIFNTPDTWQELQDKVCLLLNQVGFKAETNFLTKTPRGEVALDVYAVDPFSIDQISYVSECKNWESAVPQTIVHAFNTVMQETGANIGYIISKKGFQQGAYDYSTNTNIKVFTFEELQHRYFDRWFRQYFRKEIFNLTEHFSGYVEPFNSRRTRYFETLNSEHQDRFVTLMGKYQMLEYYLTSLSTPEIGFSHKKEFPDDFELVNLDELKLALSNSSGILFESTCYSDLLIELKKTVNEITLKFDAFFGKNIFKE